jgi:RNA polymerase sigma factor (sigma-70 family)
VAENDEVGRFTEVLKAAIARYGEEKASGQVLLDRQRDQFEGLVGLEDRFRKELLNHGWGELLYTKFVQEICEVKSDILAARPYFRIRQKEFSATISPALKVRDWKAISKHHVNYQFVRFVMQQVNWGPRSPVRRIAGKITALRNQMIETNLPMVIRQARRFFNRTPPRHITLLDFVSVGTEGLIAAVDKFCLPFRQMWRSVALYRMIGDFIEAYSKTVIHFYPRDKKRLYRANHVLARHPHGGVETVDLLTEVNRDAEPGKVVDESELADLLAAATILSADAPSNDLDVPSSVARYAAPDSVRPDLQVEQGLALRRVLTACSGLTLFERKLLRLYGGLDIPL